MGSKGGRPTDFDTETALAIIASIRAGQSRDDAARAAGVAPSTLYRWLQLGRKGADSAFNRFAEAVGQASTEARWARHSSVLARRRVSLAKRSAGA